MARTMRGIKVYSRGLEVFPNHTQNRNILVQLQFQVSH